MMLHVVQHLHQMQNAAASAPLADTVDLSDGLTGLSLDEWVKEEGIDDVRLGEMLGKDRTTAYRIRTGRTKPTFDVIEAIVALSGGKVQPNSFFRRALVRAAAPRGGGAPAPFSSTSSPPERLTRGARRRQRSSHTPRRPAATPAA